MNCQEALDLLYDIIDKEASEVDVQEVQEHLDKCRDCFGRYQVEQSIQEFIQSKLKQADSTPKLDTLKSRILAGLDEIDQEESTGGESSVPRPFRLPTIVLVAAASIVILLGAAFWGSKIYTHQKYFIPLEQAHWAVSSQLASYENNAQTEALLADADRNYKYNLNRNVGDFVLLGGISETVMGVPMEHFVYSHDTDIISVFLAPASKFTIPTDGEIQVITRSNTKLFDHNCRGCRLIFQKIGQTIVITATTNHSLDLPDFIPGRSVI